MEPIDEMLIEGWVDFNEWSAYFMDTYQIPLEVDYEIPCEFLFRFAKPKLVQLQNWNNSMPIDMKMKIRYAFQKSRVKPDHLRNLKS